MALLTKKERKTLDREGRRALRQERRAALKDAREPGDGVSINTGRLEALAVEAILDFVGAEVPGPNRLDLVLDSLADDADEVLQWHWVGPAGLLLEAVDGLAIRALVRLVLRPRVQRVYDHLKAMGRV